MNPWMNEQLAAGHRADLQRLAAGRTYPDRVPEARAARPRRLQGVRVRLGEALIRSGRRLAGPADIDLTLGAVPVQAVRFGRHARA